MVFKRTFVPLKTFCYNFRYYIEKQILKNEN